MKVIIAGSRNIIAGGVDYAVEAIISAAKEGIEITEIVSGGARGIDRYGELYAITNKIPMRIFPYKGQFGKAGGMVRNSEMAEYADALIAIWDGESKGTLDIIMKMRELKKPVYIRKVEL